MEIIPEEIVQDLTRKVTDEISIQHPLMYANHNICEFAAASKLSKVSVPDAQRHMQVLNLTYRSFRGFSWLLQLQIFMLNRAGHKSSNILQV